MALSKHDPRRFKRPADGDEDVDVAFSPRGNAAAAIRASETQPQKVAPPDKRRAALLRVLAIRGRPINRDRGMKPSEAFRAAADAYIMAEHYSFCVQFARCRAARHIPLSDLIQACLLGAYIALERFDAGHETSYRFLSYAKWYMLCECNRLLHKEECLVVVPAQVKDARKKLALTCPADLSDAEAAEILGICVDDVKSARGAHLGHEHRAVDERNRVVKRSLGDVQRSHNERVAELQSHAGLAEALGKLDPIMRGVLYREFGVGEDEGAPEPKTESSRRAVRHLALRRLKEALED